MDARHFGVFGSLSLLRLCEEISDFRAIVILVTAGISKNSEDPH